MKKIYRLFIFLSGAWWLVSCGEGSFLDETQTTDLDEETVFSDSVYTQAFLFDIYRDIGFASSPDRFGYGIPHTPSGGLQTACDEAEPRRLTQITTDIQFVSGTVNSIIISDDAWRIPYANIRKVNQLLKHLPNAPLTNYRKNLFAAEARFLRAWYYFNLVQHYGGVPLVGDTIYGYDDDVYAVRNTFEECINYIVAELDAAAGYLPVKPMGRENGRIGAGACKALKAKVLLYAASPLFNGGDFAPDEKYKALLGYPEYDKERWKLARDAARDFLAYPQYSLFVDHVGDPGTDENYDGDPASDPGLAFHRLFHASDYIDAGGFNGTILEAKRQHGKWRESLFQPPSRGGNGGGGYPYQELVDAFPMKNGKPIDDPTSGYNEEDPYANRDPRLKYSITVDQWILNLGFDKEPVDIYLGNFNGVPAGQDAVHTGTPTGYYINKMCHRSTNASHFIEVPQSRPLLRYADLLLMFAESENEYTGPTQEVYDALIAIRERAGIDAGVDGLYGLKTNMTQDEMREAIRNERRIELAFEGHRFWDVRRWMIADQTENKQMTGMEVIRDGSAVEYKRFNVRKHVWRKAMYFWPIPYSEVAKSPELLQNPYY